MRIKYILKNYMVYLGIADHVYIGKPFLKRIKSIGVYSSKHSCTYRTIVDKKKMNGYNAKFITLLVHWNNSQRETEFVSKRVYKELLSAGEVNRIKLMHPLVPEPIDVGCDSKGIYEMVIEVAVVYQPWWSFLRFING